MIMDRQEFRLYLRNHFKKKYGSLGKTAKFYGCSLNMISGVVNGHKKPTKKMLEDAGATRKVVKIESFMLKSEYD